MDSSTQSTLLKLLRFSTSQNQKIFIVGGTLRDFLLRKPCADIDLTGKDAVETGIKFSRSLSFKCVSLDKTPGRKTIRVIHDQKKYLDFTDLQGNNIEEDLSQRDFTINAMGQLLSEFLSDSKVIIDPHKGQKDLINKKIRLLNGPIISSDPLRMLRAFRFAAILNFKIDADTLTNISLHKARLKESAPERIWNELTLFLKAPSTFALLNIMHSCGLLNCLFSSPNKTLAQYQKVESLLKNPDEIFPKYSNVFCSRVFLNKHYLVKLSVLLMMNNLTSKISPIIKNFEHYNFPFSNVEKKSIQQSISGAKSLTQMYLIRNLNATYELVHKVRGEILASTILFITNPDIPNTDERSLFCNHILKFFYEQFLPTVSEKLLLNGTDIVNQFNISPSPLIGKILNCVQKEQVLGNITTRDDAMMLAENIIESQNKEPNR